MTYDPNDPTRMPGVNDPYRLSDGPHWGWYAGFLALLIIGMIVVVGGDNDRSRTASTDGTPSTSAPATTGSAPERSSPAPTITDGAPNRGGAER